MFCSIHIIPADKNIQHFLILAWKDIRLKCGPIDEVVYNYIDLTVDYSEAIFC